MLSWAGWVPTLLSTVPGPFHCAPAALAKPWGAGVAVPCQPLLPSEVCPVQEPPFRAEARVGPAGIPACPTSVCPPRFAYKDEYEKFKLYLTIILILISFTCRFLLNSRWVSCSGLGPLPPPGSGTNPLCPPQGDRCRLQLPAGLVLLHADHPREHSHQQRLSVGKGARGARRGGCPGPLRSRHWVGVLPRPWSLSLSTSPRGCGDRSDTSFPIQDQRLVGFPSLRVHLLVGSHADVVSGRAWLPGLGGGGGGSAGQKGGAPELLTLPTAFYLRPDGLMYQKFRNQFLSFSMYQSEYLRGPRSAPEPLLGGREAG